MIHKDSDSLACDLAETYRIYDMRSMPLRTVAVFAYGLGDDSRIKLALSGEKYPLETLLMASISDGLSMILWSRCKEGTPKPESILAGLTGQNEPKNEGYETGEDFEAALKKLREELNG